VSQALRPSCPPAWDPDAFRSFLVWPSCLFLVSIGQYALPGPACFTRMCLLLFNFVTRMTFWKAINFHWSKGGRVYWSKSGGIC